MKIKQKIQTMIVTMVVLIGISFSVLVADNALAQGKCGDVDTAIIQCPGDDGSTGLENSAMWSLLKIAINILTAGVGVAALAGIVYGAVLYTSAGGNPEQIKKAINMFTNIGIGVIAFAGMYALLNFIIPGGIFN